MLPRCRRCHGLLIGPQDLLGAMFPLLLLVALSAAAYGLMSGDITLLIMGLAAVSHVVLLLGTFLVLSRTAGVAINPAGYHPGCFEVSMLELECAEIGRLREEVERKRGQYDLLAARLAGREPQLASKFGPRPGRGLELQDELRALSEGIEKAEEYHRRLDIVDVALGEGDAQRAARQYEAMGLASSIVDVKKSSPPEAGVRLVARGRER
ncbi:hypothetical protein AOA80_01335 [Methanomassiliicoccales archaeon RumEn M1]|nr:hypothetical protein AOA80_01335 [Methanomassiliicoccales archaeon RumEn M1]